MYLNYWGGERGLNPRPPEPQSGALPLSYRRHWPKVYHRAAAASTDGPWDLRAVAGTLAEMVNRERLLDTFLQLCRINSPSREEAEVADWICRRLAGLGLSAEEDNAGAVVDGNCGNLVVSLPGTVPAPPILICAHMDIVEPNPGVEIVVEDGVVRTDGTAILGADDKAGCAPLIEALTIIREKGLAHGPIIAAFTICEEVGLFGAANLDTRGAVMGFVLDAGPPVGSFIVNAPGMMNIEITVMGKAAHSGVRPEEGISAVEAVADAVAGMKLGRIDEETTANIGTIHGGQARNVVCERVVMEAEARSRNPQKLAAQLNHMREQFDRAASKRGASVDWQERKSYQSYLRTNEDPVVKTAIAAAQKIGLTGQLRAAGGGSDANVFNAKGVPSIVVCTGMQKNHTHDEFCTVDDLNSTAELTLAIIQEAAKGA